MGWTFLHRERGMKDVDFFKREFGDEFAKNVKATASKAGVFYAVYETEKDRGGRLVPDENGKVRTALVVLTRRVPKDYYNFGYKDLDEFMGPCESDCPERLLDMLSPLKDEDAGDGSRWAAGWR